MLDYLLQHCNGSKSQEADYERMIRKYTAQHAIAEVVILIVRKNLPEVERAMFLHLSKCETCARNTTRVVYAIKWFLEDKGAHLNNSAPRESCDICVEYEKVLSQGREKRHKVQLAPDPRLVSYFALFIFRMCILETYSFVFCPILDQGTMGTVAGVDRSCPGTSVVLPALALLLPEGGNVLSGAATTVTTPAACSPNPCSDSPISPRAATQSPLTSTLFVSAQPPPPPLGPIVLSAPVISMGSSRTRPPPSDFDK
jgi:hypothetical protein